jgi:hypothetical protein
MSILAAVIGFALALLPLVIGYVARSKGRSALAWGLLSIVLTPFGSLAVLLMLPERDGSASEAGIGRAKLDMLSDVLAKIGFGSEPKTTQLAEQDPAEARMARVDQLIAERLNAIKATPTPGSAPAGVAAGLRPTFGKRRQG